MEVLIPIVVLIVIGFLIGITIGRILKEKDGQIKTARQERDIYSQIIREANIHQVPPKDLGKEDGGERIL